MDDVKTLPFKPFEGDYTKIVLDKKIKISQLQHELIEATGKKIQAVSIEEGGVETLYLQPAVKLDIVNQVISSHNPEDTFGLSEGTQEFLLIKEKLSTGATLTTKEISAVLRSLLHTPE